MEGKGEIMTTEIKHPCIRDGTECRWPECVKWQIKPAEIITDKIKLERKEEAGK